MNLNNLTGKTAIVTGAAQGLSRGMAEGLLEAGASVVIMDINPKAEATAEELRQQGYDCQAVICNLTDDATLVSHDLKRDILLLKRAGVELSARHYDTSLAHYLL
uniref:SDR family NAD(P)-dependent oxidoreductase n=1 Tax=Faecalibaculum rodentium TaxID=1702221 RepID=UPI00266F37A8